MAEPMKAEAAQAPDGWPAMSLDQIRDRLCAPGQKFEMETLTIRGVPTRVWKNAPPTLAALARMGRAHGERTFTVYEDERVSYEGWFRATAALAEELSRRGVGKGDRVALCMRNLPEWPVVFFAAASLGAIVVPLNAWWTGEELAYGLQDSGARALVCDDEHWARIAPERAGLPALAEVLVSRAGGPVDGADRLEDVIGTTADYDGLPARDLPEVDIAPDDDATIFYTSGTTGKPKGAIGTHRNICSNVLSSGYLAARTALRRGEAPPEPEPKTGLLVIPLFHVTACSARLMGAIAGGHTLVFMHKWDTKQAFEIIERERVSSTGGVPAIAWQLIEHPDRDKYDLSSIEGISYGGASAPPELVRKIRSVFGAEPGSGWGMTETMATVTAHASEDYLNRPDSCGPAVAVADLKIMSMDGSEEMPTGERGELWARGPMITRGYWNKPEATAETFVDGWVRTGDIAKLDEEGFCFILDRAKDVIIRGGENIYSVEVENCLYDHPAVTDAAVVPLPHRTLGEEPGAAVHLAPGTSATEAELQAWVAERLARFKVPVRILFCDDPLPRNANGKILKPEVKALLVAEDAPKTVTA